MLGPPDSHYLRAAIGWLELGNPAEAEAELANLSPAACGHPDTLEARWLLAANRSDWETGLAVAQKLLQTAPDRPTGWLHQAYALRRVAGGGVKQAKEALAPAFKKFPSESVIPYNLACYSCLLGDLRGARMWLRRAISSGGLEAIKKLALEDPDLAPLRAEIEDMED